MEKNLKKIVLLFTLVVSVAAVQSADVDNEMALSDDGATYYGSEEGDDSSYMSDADYGPEEGDGSSYMSDADAVSMSADGDNGADYAGTFNDVANYSDDQTNYADSANDQGYQSDYDANYYAQDAEMPQPDEVSDESMSEPILDDSYDLSSNENQIFYTDLTSTPMTDEIGVEDYEQSSE